jgi:threonine aldolase
MIDLRSDTLTRPTEAMLRAMFQASAGDDNFGEDRSTAMLENHCAELFGLEAAVFVPTGTMSNQIALRVHTRPGDEVVVDESYHLNVYESAPSADLAGVSLNTVASPDGILDPYLVDAAMEARCRDPRYSQARLVSIENTINYRAGRVFPLDRLADLRRGTERRHLRLHMDGARLFNAVVATGTKPAQYAEQIDTLSVCFAKGLGAPFGSVLAGPADLMAEARYYRKSYGGAMHQCGGLAEAARYALRHNIARLADDHSTAGELARRLADNPLIRLDPEVVETNIVVLDVSSTGQSATMIADLCRTAGLLVVPLTSRHLRMVTWMGIDRVQVIAAADILHRVIKDISSGDSASVRARCAATN